ncbi:MAG TPA: hypothetical protein PLJ21_13030, partial [Pseudobdellovibrionaceae bacterium]|nr:hypothetical protein [Pseudobdellovibrionaceae bacterium]
MNLEDLTQIPGVEKILIFGIGNLGRQDDGLGIRLVEMLEKEFALNAAYSTNSADSTNSKKSTDPIQTKSNRTVFFESNYQLNIEDALLISEYDLVIFIDASQESHSDSENLSSSFRIREIRPSDEVAFSTHAMSMSSVLGFCSELYGKNPKSFLITLPGFSWEISDEMSIQANKNLESSFAIL